MSQRTQSHPPTAQMITMRIILSALMLTITGSAGRSLAQSAPSASDSYAIRLIVMVPPLAGTRVVYATFSGTVTYALSSEGDGRYSLEAQARTAQSGAEIELMNGGVEERRDRITWNAYPGYKVSVETDYRLNLIGGLELDHVAEAVGTWTQVSSAPAPASQGDSNPLINPTPDTSGAAGSSNSGTLSSADTAPAWATGGGNATSTGPLTATQATSSPLVSATAPLTTATITLPLSDTSGPIPAPHPAGISDLINPLNVYGLLALICAAAALIVPKFLRRLLTPSAGSETNTDEDDYEDISPHREADYDDEEGHSPAAPV